MKTGEVFSACLMAEQTSSGEAAAHLIPKQLLRSRPWCPLAPGDFCWMQQAFGFCSLYRAQPDAGPDEKGQTNAKM